MLKGLHRYVHATAESHLQQALRKAQDHHTRAAALAAQGVCNQVAAHAKLVGYHCAKRWDRHDHVDCRQHDVHLKDKPSLADVTAKFYNH